jgi:CheY-like chemotaxis protein
MDGIEAASAIRNLEGDRFKNLPIIALTANAVFGMREMFLASGFNDYLAKPIEISKLDEILARWIPMDKRVGKGSLDPSYAGGNMPVYTTGVSNTLSSRTSGKGEDPGIVPIEGIDVRSGMESTGSFSWLNYCDVLSLFCQDASSRLELLRGVPGEGELVSFVTRIHAIKGASSSIGAAGIAKQAAALEEAGKTGDTSFIRHELGVFHAELESLVARINAVLGR